MHNTDFVRRFKKMFWAPTTKLGNPLFKRTAETNDTKILTIEEKDPEYNKLINKKWSSPSNVRAILIGVNKAFIIYHRGLSEGDNKVSEVHVNKSDYIYSEIQVDRNSYNIYTGDNLTQDPNTRKFNIVDKNKIENIVLNKDPLSTANDFALPNLECILISWTALSASNYNNAQNYLKDIIPTIFTSKRLEKVFYINQDVDKILGKYEGQIREYAQSKYTSISQFIPDIEQFTIISNQVNFKKPLLVQIKQWSYDKFLSGWNNTLNKDIERNPEGKVEQKDEFANLICLNKNVTSFQKNFENNNGIIVQYKDDYILKVKLCRKGETYYNEFNDTIYDADPKKVVIIGTQNESWLQKPQKIINNYVKLNNLPITIEDFKTLGSNILEIKPKNIYNKCYAYKVPASKIDMFYITAESGNIKINSSKTQHGEGDWIICYEDENGKPDYNNQNVINGALFWNIYKNYIKSTLDNLDLSKIKNEIFLYLKEKQQEFGILDKEKSINLILLYKTQNDIKVQNSEIELLTEEFLKENINE